MSDSIQVTINNERLEKVLTLLSLKIKDMSPIMRHISERMIQGVEENFDTEGASLGDMWAKLTDKTEKERKKLGFTPIKILTRSGALASSISNNHTAHSATVGTNSKYAMAHHFGCNDSVNVGSHTRTVKGKSYNVKSFTRKMNLEARPFMGLNQKDVDAVVKIIENALFKVL